MQAPLGGFAVAIENLASCSADAVSGKLRGGSAQGLDTCKQAPGKFKGPSGAQDRGASLEEAVGDSAIKRFKRLVAAAENKSLAPLRLAQPEDHRSCHVAQVDPARTAPRNRGEALACAAQKAAASVGPKRQA